MLSSQCVQKRDTTVLAGDSPDDIIFSSVLLATGNPFVVFLNVGVTVGVVEVY